jgi:hypothetical protein
VDVDSREFGVRDVAEGLDRHAQALPGFGWQVGQRFHGKSAGDFQADQRLELRIVGFVSDGRKVPRYAGDETARRVELVTGRFGEERELAHGERQRLLT